jgi:iron complex outermembrane recepter protein
MTDARYSLRPALASAVLWIYGATQPSFGQTAATDAGQSPGGASQISDNSTSLEEITVSAQRRGDERALDTPISIGVLSGASLDNGSAVSVSDALSQVGGVTIVENQPGQTIIGIRGVIAGSTGTSTTGYYLDEVPFSFIDISQSPDANAFDLQRVEVLRGPQGTLFGANAMAGVVRILTNDPDLNEFEAKARVTGSYTDGGSGNYGADLALNVPLIPGELAIRGVASTSDLSGFISSTSTGQKRINDSQLQSYRFKVDAQPTDDLNVKFGYTHSQIANGAPSTSDENLTTPFSGQQPDSRRYDTYNLITNYDLGSFSLLSSTSYLNYLTNSSLDILLSGTTPFSYFNHYGLESAAQEFRLNSKLQGPWQWSAGVYFKHTREMQYQSVSDLSVFPDPYEVSILSKSYAVFGELTRKLWSDKLELTGGLRYFHDDQSLLERSNFFPGPLAAPTDAAFEHVTGRVVLKYTIDNDHMLYSSVATGFRSGLNQSAAVIAVDPAFAPLKPDSLTTYEIGGKAQTLGGRLSFDSAVYYTTWKDVQQSLVLPVGFVAYVNAGRAEGAGIDFGTQYQATNNLQLQASVGWNGLKFEDNVLQGNTVLFSQGDRLNESPAVTASVGSNYHFPVGIAGLSGVFGTNVQYTSQEILRSLSGPLLTATESANIFLAGARLGVEADHWSTELYGDNLFNNREAATPPDINVDFQSVRLRPRTIGMQANYKF